MKQMISLVCIVAIAMLASSGCGGRSTAESLSGGQGAAAAAPNPAYLLAAEPTGALGVAEVRRNGTDGQEVVVSGWIAGTGNPFVDGRAAFTLVDSELPPMECAEKPYLFCCMPKEALLPNLIMVKFVDAAGQTIATDARQLLGVREGSAVVVQGRLQAGEDGTVHCLLASKLFNRGDAVFTKKYPQLSGDSDGAAH